MIFEGTRFLFCSASLAALAACSTTSNDSAGNGFGIGQNSGTSTGSSALTSTGATTGTSVSGTTSTSGLSSTGGPSSTTGTFIATVSGGGGDAGATASNIDGGCGGMDVAASSDVDALLVIDRSSSMAFTPMGYTMDKWDALNMALPPALMAVQNQISLGLEFFGSPGSNSCAVAMGDLAVQVPIGKGATTVPQIVQQLAATMPTSSTPTAAALRAAFDYFTTGGGMALTGTKYVVLATDGGPNCNAAVAPCDATLCTNNIDNNCGNANCCANAGSTGCLDDLAVVSAIDDLLMKAGVKTIVVGIPGTEQYSQILDTFATHGGAPNTTPDPDGGASHSYYAVDANAGVQGLQDTLTTITKSLVMSCTFVLATDPLMREVEVFVDGVATTKGKDWTLDTSTSPPSVVLQGDVCSSVMTTGAQRVQIRFGCPVH